VHEQSAPADVEIGGRSYCKISVCGVVSIYSGKNGKSYSAIYIVLMLSVEILNDFTCIGDNFINTSRHCIR